MASSLPEGSRGSSWRVTPSGHVPGRWRSKWRLCRPDDELGVPSRLTLVAAVGPIRWSRRIASWRRLERAEAMNVLESRAGRPLRLRPWVLLLGAAVIVAAALYLATGSSPSDASRLGDRRPGARRAFRLEPVAGERILPEGHQPRARRAGRATEHHDLGDVLGAGLAAHGDAAPVTRHRRQVGPDERHDPHLRPRLATDPLHPGGADDPGRVARACTPPTAPPWRRRTRSRSTSPPATRCACSSCWPGSTSSRSASPRPARRRAGPTWPRTRPGPSPGAGPACPPSSPRSGPRAPRTRSPRPRSRPSRPRTASGSTGSPARPSGPP